MTVPPLTPRNAPFELEAWDIPHARPFLCDIHVDADQLSRVVPHVSNVEFIRWFDRVAELHADSWGDTRTSLLGTGVMWFVARHEIDYLAEAGPDDDLVVATWVHDRSRVKSWRHSIIVRPRDETTVCRARTLWVLVDLETRRPTRIPADMAERLDPLRAGPARPTPSERPCTSP